MDVTGSAGGGRRAERMAQARRLVGQARQDRTVPWYLAFVGTAIGAGASFNAFGAGIGFLYALVLSGAFAVLSWGTLRLVPAMLADLSEEGAGTSRTWLTLLRAPVTARGFLVLAATIPVAVALAKTVGFFFLGGVALVLVATGLGLAAAWALNRP
ncbi:hypothetical protein [Pseudofrankia inefficax]|uniref:Uncharacterized protein n=1 Tax=Pseudofrankia inefficax (strain DSM 45817 / CECT 9037 / DDB 130130 / EuI1c) TaxID=298654 RepID=E3J523_PSEI1|nr:hypothetical protein [Pseudofrankia inefficax]ADP79474.1 hypothetical protein FraEuI1c_1407 [Pseudofrankia inefficax]